MLAERSFVKADYKWSRMDHFNKLDESVITSSGCKRKIKDETFSCNLAKAARYNVEGKALCIGCNRIHTVYDHNNNVCHASILSSEEITKSKSKTWNVELSAFAKKTTVSVICFCYKTNFEYFFNFFYFLSFPVAQLVEHGASNAKIMGSIPRESKSW